MQEYDIVLTILVIISGFNAHRFEETIRRQMNSIQDLLNAKSSLIATGLTDKPEFKGTVQEIETLEAAIALKGNWLPSKYRQFTMASIFFLTIRITDESSLYAIIGFCIFCLLFSTSGIKFWIRVSKSFSN